MIQQAKLRTMILKETSASMLWHELSSVEKAAYVAANPSSKFASAAIHIKHPGRYHEHTGVPEGEKIPISIINKDIKDGSPEVKKEARFAKNARAWKH